MRATIGVALAAAVAGGVLSAGYGVVLNALVEQRELEAGLLSVCVSAALATLGFGAVFVTGLMRKVGGPLVVLIGALIAGGSLVALGRVTSEPAVLIVSVALAVGLLLGAVAPLAAYIGSAFSHSKGAGILTALSGWSVGAVVAAGALPNLVDDHGVRDTLTGVAVAATGLLAVAAVVFVRRADAFAEAPRIDHLTGGVPYHLALRTRFFGCVTAAYTAIVGVQLGAVLHLYRLVNERAGKPAAHTALVVFAVSGLVSRFVVAAAVSRFDKLRSLLWMAVVQAIALGVLSVAMSHWALYAGAGALAAADVTMLAVLPLLLFDRFGSHDFGLILGRAIYIMVAGFAAGPALFGIMYDTEGYTAAYLIGGALTLLGWVVLGAAGTGRRRPRAAETPVIERPVAGAIPEAAPRPDPA